MSRVIAKTGFASAWLFVTFLLPAVAGLGPVPLTPAQAEDTGSTDPSGDPLANKFPKDYILNIPRASPETTYHKEVFVANSNSEWIRADLEDFNLMASEYKVQVVIKPPGCTTPADWHDGAWNLPDWGNTLAPIDWDAKCQPAGQWTVEIYGEAAPFATGSLRVHVSQI